MTTEFVDRWRDGDPGCHCTHCDACGRLFPTQDLGAHQHEAHLGGKQEHAAHQEAGCAMLVSMASGIAPEGLDAWVETELKLRDVREALAAPRKPEPKR